MAQAKKKSKTWHKTGIGATINMDTEIIEGKLCARLATMKANSCRVSLYYDFQEDQFHAVVSLITGPVFVQTLPDKDHAQILYNRLPRRVHPSKLESVGITNPLDSDTDDLEAELSAQFDYKPGRSDLDI